MNYDLRDPFAVETLKLRDHIAVEALKALIMEPQWDAVQQSVASMILANDIHPTDVTMNYARASYAMADAMLAERGRDKTEGEVV